MQKYASNIVTYANQIIEYSNNVLNIAMSKPLAIKVSTH